MSIFSIFKKENINKTISNKPFMFTTPADALSVTTEQFKSIPIDSKMYKTISDELGEPHPFDYNVCEGIYSKYGLISGIIDKIIDFTIGPGIYIECEDKRGQKILQDWIDDNNLANTLKPQLREACTKGPGYIEVAVDSNKNVKIKPINSTSMFKKRKPSGEIEKYIQYTGDFKRIDKNKAIEFTPDEICEININQVGDSAYGLGYIYPALDIINNFLMSQKSLHILMKRKAGAPIHVSLGNVAEGDIPSEDDVTDFGKKMQVMNEKTEWVTGDNCKMEVLNFGNVSERFESILNNDFLLISYAFQIPEALMGKGNINQGIADVEMDGFERKIKSTQLEIEKSVKEKILNKVLFVNGLDLKYKLKWGQPSNDDKFKKLSVLKEILATINTSKGLAKQIEKDIATTMDYNLEEMEQDNISEEENKPAFKPGQKEREEEEEEQPALKVPGQGSKEKTDLQYEILNKIKGIYNTEICPHCVQESVNMKVSEWTNFNLPDIEKSIIKIIGKDKFENLAAINAIEKKAGYLTPMQIIKLKDVLIKGFKKDLTIKEIENLIRNDVGVKELKDYNLREVTDKVLLSEERRINMIARTETTRMSNLGALADYKDKGVENVRWVSTLGSQRLCEFCESLNGMVWPIDAPAYIPGVNSHVNCRCRLVNVEYRTEKVNEKLKIQDEFEDIEVKLNTGNGKTNIITDKINGTLKAIIIDTNSQIQINIGFADYPLLPPIYENKALFGTTFISPATDSSSNTSDKFTYTQHEWTLNDKLKIEVNGPMNVDVNVKFRIE